MRKRLRCRCFARRVVHLFGGIEVEDFASLSRTRINRAQMFAPFHFPNRGHDPIFLYRLISYLFCILIVCLSRPVLSHKFPISPLSLFRSLKKFCDSAKSTVERTRLAATDTHGLTQ